MQDIVQKDMNFLKNSWANLADIEPNDDVLNGNIQQHNTYIGAPSRVLYGKLPVQQEMSKEADDSIPEVDDQGFQMVTSKSTKRTEKKATMMKNPKNKPYITRSKVGAPKPFR